jgi:ankyrin repeat protein
MAASKAGHSDVVRLLLERGADAGDRNKNGQTARQLAELGRHPDVVLAIDEHGRSSGWFGSR